MMKLGAHAKLFKSITVLHCNRTIYMFLRTSSIINFSKCPNDNKPLINEIMLQLICRDTILARVSQSPVARMGRKAVINERKSSFRRRATINFGHRRLLPEGTGRPNGCAWVFRIAMPRGSWIDADRTVACTWLGEFSFGEKYGVLYCRFRNRRIIDVRLHSVKKFVLCMLLVA